MSRPKPKRHNRRPGMRQKISGDIILIVCEGEKTEPEYFYDLRKKWRITPIQIQIPDKKSGWAPLTIVQQSLKIKEKLERQQDIQIDEVWCVFDHEGCNKDSNYENAVTFAKDKGIKTAISSPSFEFWYLIHFIYTTQPFENATQVIKELKKFISTYKKSKSYLEETIDKIETAINHAQKIRKYNAKTNTICPSTNVDELIQKIKSLSREFI